MLAECYLKAFSNGNSAADLVDVRMQNVALLGTLAKEQVLPGVTLAHYRQALTDLLPPAAQEKNLQLFARMAG